MQGAIALALVALGTALARGGMQTMVDYTAPVFWFFFLMTGVALFILRRQTPDSPQPFRVPLYPLTPLVFCATCAYMLYSSLTFTGPERGDRRGDRCRGDCLVLLVALEEAGSSIR